MESQRGEATVLDRSTVVLADAFTRSGLATARALGRHGLDVVVVSRGGRSLVRRSRYVRQCEVGPDPISEGDAYAAFVGDLADRCNAGLVIPVTDAAMTAMNARRGSIPDGAKLALPGADVVDAVLDKRLNLDIASAAGVPCPPEYDCMAGEVPEFPVVLKNANPDNRALKRPVDYRVIFARNAGELDERLAVLEHSDSDVLFQQFISGRTINVCVFAVEGEVQAMHGYLSIRKSLHEGIAREIIPVREDAQEYTRDLVAALRWTGVAHIQFLVDLETHELFYMETNGRFWASTQGSINAGWNFPVWLYEHHVNERKPDVPPIEVGSRTVYFKADLLQLVRYWFGGRPPSVDSRGRLSATWQVLKDLRPSVHADVGDWRDPLPSLQDMLDIFRPSNFRSR